MDSIKENPSEACYDFASSFVQLSPVQREAFLENITTAQCNLLRMCIYNLLLNTSIDIDPMDRNYLKQKQGILRKLASKRLCTSEKRGILKNKGLLIKRALRIVLKYLTEERERVKSK